MYSHSPNRLGGGTKLNQSMLTNNSVPVFVPEKYKNMDTTELKITKVENLTRKYH